LNAVEVLLEKRKQKKTPKKKKKKKKQKQRHTKVERWRRYQGRDNKKVVHEGKRERRSLGGSEMKKEGSLHWGGKSKTFGNYPRKVRKHLPINHDPKGTCAAKDKFPGRLAHQPGVRKMSQHLAIRNAFRLGRD